MWVWRGMSEETAFCLQQNWGNITLHDTLRMQLYPALQNHYIITDYSFLVASYTFRLYLEVTSGRFMGISFQTRYKHFHACQCCHNATVLWVVARALLWSC